MPITIFFYIFLFVFGIIVGSFLNVCIYRIPLKETVVTEPSHCMSCGHRLAWYDLFPLFSWIFLGGKCRYCKAKISKQYPIVEGLNGIVWVFCFLSMGFFPHLSLYWKTDGNLGFLITDLGIYSLFSYFLGCLVCSALIVLSVIDWRTYEIPFKINIFIFTIGLIKLAARMLVDSKIYCQNLTDDISFFEKLNAYGAWKEFVIGFFAVSVPLLIILLISKGKAMGGGDVKLMAAAGLFLGWKLAIVALLFGCLYGSVIHIIRMKIEGEGSKLAMGPYLSGGIVTAMWFGQKIVEWYSSLF